MNNTLEVNGTYVDGMGSIVRIYECRTGSIFDSDAEMYPFCGLKNGLAICTYTVTGKFFHHANSRFDLVRRIDKGD